MNKDLFEKYKKFMNKRKMIERTKKIKFAIIIPYRDDIKHVREKQLNKFIDIIPNYFKQLKSFYEYKIYIIEQNNKTNKFNRGVLLNIGFLLLKDNFDYFIFHDIDLIPNNDLLCYYELYPFNPVHIGDVNTKYSVGGKYFGGVNSFNKKHFELINGFPNNYWGWGGEDDELYDRVVENNLEIIVPIQGDYTEMKHNRPTKTEINEKKMMLRLEHNNWKNNGLSNIYKTNKNISNNMNNKLKINYKIVKKEKLNDNAELISILF